MHALGELQAGAVIFKAGSADRLGNEAFLLQGQSLKSFPL